MQARGDSSEMRKAMVMLGWIVGVLAVGSIAGYVLLRGESKAPAPGAAAPDFTLNSQDGKAVSLHDFRGKWVVLYFYPKDFTSGCTVEAHNFQRDLGEYEKRNAVIFGVSMQDENSHKEFCAKEGLNFKLLADTKKEVSKKYDSVMNLVFASLSARHTFLIDPEGLVRKVWLKVEVQKHSGEVLEALEQAQKSAAR